MPEKKTSATLLRGKLKPVDARKIIALLRKAASQIIPEMSQTIFSHMDTELLELAKVAESNTEQSEYFEAMSSLEKAKKQVSQDFLKEILSQFDEPRNLEELIKERKKKTEARKEQSQEQVKLSLVNTEEFEAWLAVENTISRGERMYEKFLFELTQRMGMMVPSWKNKNANPLSTTVFTYAFDHAMHKVDLSKEIRQRVYSGYELKVLPLFQKLYISTTGQMEDAGVFPKLDEDYVSSTPVDLSDKAKPHPPSRRRSFSSSRHRPDAQPEPAVPLASDDRVPVAPFQHPKKILRTNDVGAAIKNIYSSVRELMAVKDGQTEAYSDDEYLELDEVQDLLSALEGEMHEANGARMPVRQRLLENASRAGERRVDPATVQTLEVVENLIDSIEDDALLMDNTKNWIRKLELTLDKVAANNGDFLNENNPHRSLDVINQIALLGGAGSNSARRVVDEIIDEINSNYDADPEVFDRALTEMQPLVDQLNRAFTGNVQRTVKASLGQQTLRNAQRAVLSEMDERYAGREVPEVLYKLLMPGWRNLLVNTHLREGHESVEWQKHVQTLDQLFQYVDKDSDPKASPDYMPPESLLQHIESGLDSIAYEPGQRIPLINSLKQVLFGDKPVSEMPTVAFNQNTIAEKLGFEDVSAQEEARRVLREQNEADALWQRCFDRAQRLHVGTWVEFRTEQEPEISIVAWVNKDETRFVFVTQRGVKSNDISVEGLATMIHLGQVRILEEPDIPVTERASHRMLQNMHNQLTHQATHDDLTGLINRKEFSKELKSALDVAKRNDSINLCATLDLDQFKVINTAGGPAAGDRLLITVARMLEDKVRTFGAKVARLGGDEFGLLVNDCGPEVGAALSKEILDSVKALRFEWEGDVFSLTASIGLYYMHKDTDSVNRIVSSADASCIAAKEAGRGRIHVFKEDDIEMSYHQEVMEFVSHIDKALDENRFELNCQKIQSIDATFGYCHYEVLLTVLDDNDTPLQPQDFIIAAEKFNRMGALDRWVIRNTFKFIADNILKLDHLGMFAINISGNSLTEDDFMEFVLEQFNELRLPPSKICFEITETAAIGRLEDVIEFMERMKIIGVRFSLDDFGTGFSSYSYLRNLPVDYLKIDGIFVKDIKNNPSDYAVVKSINEIGHCMGKKTIAEFVEDEETLEILREIGVDYAQGWGIGQKMPITELLN